jgi:hypothetical protein
MINGYKAGKRVHHVEWVLYFELVESPGSGYCFPCDERGNVHMDRMTPAGLSSLQECRRDEEMEPREYSGPTVYRQAHSYWEPASGTCHCGTVVHLHSDTACPTCGQWYNAVGQELRPPREWGEDTGERFDDTGHCYYSPYE